MRPAAALVLYLLACPAVAQDGQTAFQNGDYATARAEWQQAADEGDARALFDLGTLADLGLGEPRDPAKAFRLYLSAADLGVPEAQFNVAVMLDAGALRPPEPAAAAVWYARAAANGMDRAAYNLGQAYATGRGVPANPDLARHWLTRTGIAAASSALAALPPSDPPPELRTPVLSGAYRLEGRVELVWSSAPSAGSGTWTVELVEIASGRMVHRVETDASAIVLPIAADAPKLAWRVLNRFADGRDYAASPWAAVDSDAALGPLFGLQVTFRPADDDARRLAEVLAGDFAASGMTTRIVPGADGAASVVRYSMPADRDAAIRVAAALPGMGPANVERQDGLSPGEIAVPLVGGIAP